MYKDNCLEMVVELTDKVRRRKYFEILNLYPNDRIILVEFLRKSPIVGVEYYIFKYKNLTSNETLKNSIALLSEEFHLNVAATMQHELEKINDMR